MRFSCFYKKFREYLSVEVSLSMEKDLNYYMHLPYRVEVLPDEGEGGYAFRIPELPGCLTASDTLEEGFRLLEDAKRCWISSCLEQGTPVPEPSNLDDYSGQFKLRIPKSLHRQLAQRSTEEGISMNQLCLYLLSRGLQF